MLQLLIIALSVGAILLISLFVFSKNTRSITNVLFSLLGIALASWTSFSYVPLYFSVNQLAFIRLTMFSVVFMNTAFFFLIQVFPNTKYRFSIIQKLLLLYSVIVLMDTQTPFLFSSITVSNGIVSPNAGPGILLFLIHAIIFALGSFVILIRRYLKSTGIERAHLRFILYASAPFFTLVPAANFILPVVFHYSYLIALSPFYTILFALLIAYAIVRQQLFDVRAIVAKSVTYALVLITMAIIYSLAAFSFSNLIFETFQVTGTNQNFVYAALAVVLAFTFQPLQAAFSALSDRVFYRDIYDTQELLRRLSTVMATNFELDPLLTSLLQDITQTMRLSHGSFILLHDHTPYLAKAYGFDRPPHYETQTIAALTSKREMVVYDELPEDGLKHLMNELNSAIAAPLIAEKDFVGLLLLGEKRSGEVYSQQDLRVIEILAPEISIAVANAQAVDQIQKFNVTLKKEVADATAELQRKNSALGRAIEELKSLDVMKDQLIAVTSHELKSPASVIQNYLWVLLHEPDKETKFAASDHLKLEKSFNSLQSLIHLINDILNASRIEGGRMSVREEVVNPTEIINQEIENYLPKAQEKGLSLTAVGLDKAQPIKADKDKFTEVIANLVSNAIKYTDQGSVNISVEVKDSKEIFHVSDTGRGIAQEHLPHLFEKFYREDASLSASNVMTGGTGLGLYITKSYVDLMKGDIWLDTVKDKGSTFSFSLPLAPIHQ